MTLLGNRKNDTFMTDTKKHTPLLFILRFFARLPMRTVQTFARSIAGMMLLFPNTGIAKTVRRNLIIAYPEKTDAEIAALTAASMRSQAMSMMEFVKSWGNPPQYSIDQIRDVHGKDMFIEALKNPKGLIGIVPHHGTWEMMNAWVSQYTNSTIMYKPAEDPSLDAFVLEARSRLDATLVPTDESGVRAMFRAIKKGGFGAILPDHVPYESGGILSPFFGRQTLTTTLVSRLAQKTGSGVVILYCLRRQDGDGFDIYFETLPDEIRSEDLQVSVDTMNRVVEAIIRRDPEQYQWAYKRFKDAPQFNEIYRMTEDDAKVALAKMADEQARTIPAAE